MHDEPTLFGVTGPPTHDARSDVDADDARARSEGVEDAADGDAADAGVEAVFGWFAGQRDVAERFGVVLRRSIDEVLDGARTGRFDLYDSTSVSKTERTYLGTKVEIVVKAEFALEPGRRMDYQVAGHDVDAKFSLSGSWQIPREAMGHLCLVLRADDRRSSFGVGLVRISAQRLNHGNNQDGKKTLNSAGRAAIRWLVRDGMLPPNQLLDLDPRDRDAVLAVRSGQQRVTEFLRRFQGRIVLRTTASTLAQQQDPLKRFRDARIPLAPEGVVVLGHQNDSPRVAAALALPVPQKGQFVAARLVPATESDNRPTALIAGGRYAVANPDEPRTPAPPIHY